LDAAADAKIQTDLAAKIKLDAANAANKK